MSVNKIEFCFFFHYLFFFSSMIFVLLICEPSINSVYRIYLWLAQRKLKQRKNNQCEQFSEWFL